MKQVPTPTKYPYLTLLFLLIDLTEKADYIVYVSLLPRKPFLEVSRH